MKKITNSLQYKCEVLNCYMCLINYGKYKIQLLSNGFNILEVDGSTHVSCW